MTTTEVETQGKAEASTAEATRAFEVAEATGRETMRVSIALAEKTYSVATATAEAARDRSVGQSEAQRLDDTDAAGRTQSISAAQAEKAFLAARYQEAELRLGALDTLVQLPWTGFLAAKAAAEHTWAVQLGNDYVQFRTDLANAEVTYGQAVSTAYVARSNSIAMADETLAHTLAARKETRENALAAADRVFEHSMAPARKTHAIAMAQAEGNYTVAVATADRDLVVDPAFNHGAALSAADAQKKADARAAARAKGLVDARAKRDWTLSVGMAWLSYGTAAGAAWLAHVNSISTAEKTFDDAESAAHETRDTTVARLTRAFEQKHSADYHSHLVAMAQAHSSPWATHAASMAAAEKDRSTATSNARHDKRASLASAEKAKEVAEAAARQNLANSRAAAKHDKIKALDQAAVDKAMADANALVDLAVAGWHLGPSDLPGGLPIPLPGLPDQLGDYWQFSRDPYYQQLVDHLFSTQADNGWWWPTWDFNWHWSYGYGADDGDYLQEALCLPTHPGGGGVLADFVFAVRDYVDPKHPDQGDSLDVCFAAGTPVLTTVGWKPIETLRVGDYVLSASDREPEGPIEPKRIERVFHNPPAALLTVHIANPDDPTSPGTIRCTHDHLFYVRHRGWTPAEQLRPGDALRAHDGTWSFVSETFDNGDLEPVYNFHVADHHTYFVGCPTATLSALVHNEYGDSGAKVAVAGAAVGEAEAPVEVAITDFSRIPHDRIEAMIADGLAQRSLKHPGFVTVLDIHFDRVVVWLLQEYEVTETSPLQLVGEVYVERPTGEKAYRLVAEYTLVKTAALDNSSVEWEDAVAQLRTTAIADRYAARFWRNTANTSVQIAVGTLIFAYHMVPLGAFADHAYQGEWGDATFALGGDAAFFFVGPAAKAAKTARGAMYFRVAGSGIQGGIAAARLTQGALALRDGDNLAAMGYFGEATLRLLGMSRNAVAALKLRAAMRALNGFPETTAASVVDKLRRYLLNPDHPSGGPKAKWFKEALGFTQDNLDDLAKQIDFDQARAVQSVITDHGPKFEQVIEILGANGKQIRVLFVWIRNKDGIVRLVTAVPTPK